MQVVAQSNYLRISPKKVVPIAKQIRELSADKALTILDLTYKKAAAALSKTIASAVANARHNYGLKDANMVIKRIDIGPGPIYKRYRPAARGRVHPILKRTTNIRVVLDSGEVKPAEQLESKLVQSNKQSQIDSSKSEKSKQSQDTNKKQSNKEKG